MRYVAECYLQRSRFADVAAVEGMVTRAAEAVSAAGEPITHIRSTFVEADEICFHVFDADSIDAVWRAGRAAGVKPIRIVTAVEREGGADSTQGGLMFSRRAVPGRYQTPKEMTCAGC